MHTGIGRLLPALLTWVIALVATSASASAAEVLSDRLSVPTPADSSCFAGLRSGDGVVRRDFTAPATGRLTARLRAAGGDWDVAVFPRDGGDAVAAAASRGADEVAGGYAFEGEHLTVQACRRSGGAESADLTVALDEIDTSGKPATASLVDVSTPTRKRKEELNKLGLDLTEHGGDDFVAVVLHGPEDAAKLRDAGFIYKVEVADLAAQSKRDRTADARFAASTRSTALPSGRTEYRHLADYGEELKQLAADNPDLVKPITLPFKTWEGRTVEGIEITTNPNARDGKPVFLQMGLHHAREWPSGEHALEWAYELVSGYRAGDSRTKKLVQSTRTIVVPVVNPDGFNGSRTAGELEGGGDGRGTPNEGEDDEIVNILAHPEEYRRKNCRFPDDSEHGSCAPGLGLAENGVDPNRNYGGFWGGPGASASRENLTYRGPGPFTEPETQNVRHLVSTRHVTTLITNHTFSNLVLRPPGVQIQGDSPDEPIYKALGQAMSDENGYQNIHGYELYDTTGTTEDWTYYATGGLGYTFEIGCVTQGDEPGECDTGHFHPPFEEMVKEWDGRTSFSDTAERDGGGNREAYYKAQENTADPAKHAVLAGSAPPGAILRLAKAFDTPTSQKNDDGSRRTFRDQLDTTMQVPDSGRFEWHINQSTRPLVIEDRGRPPTGEPSDPLPPFDGSPATAAPCAEYNNPPASCVDDHVLTVPSGAGIDNATATVRIEWLGEGSDWDLKLYRDVDNDGAIGPDDGAPVGTSGQGLTDFEQVVISEPVLVPGAQYIARVINWAAAAPYEGTVTFGGPEYQQAQRESWTLTCEPTEDQPATSQEISIDRGQSKQLDLGGCAARGDGDGGGGGAGGGAGDGGTGDGGGTGGVGDGGQPSGERERGRDKRDKPRVRQSVRFSRDGRVHRARMRGKLIDLDDRDGLSGASAGQRCAGSVSVSVKAGKRRITLRRAKVSRNCRFAKSLKFSSARVPRKYRGSRARLRVVSRYNGSKYLRPAKKVSSARVKRR